MWSPKLHHALCLLLFGTAHGLQAVARQESIPPPPEPEPITLQTLTLPPSIPDDSVAGDCTRAINPRGTGCIRRNATDFAAGNFLPDGKHVLVAVYFVGGTCGSLYDGHELLAVKTGGETFSNGDPWKCLTCGVPKIPGEMHYAQAFHDGKRALAGLNLLDCGEHDLVSPECGPDTLNIYSIYWQISNNATAPGGDIRELRIHPDNVHLGFSSFTYTGGRLGQFAYMGRLKFNPSPDFGLPRAPRYDLVKVTRFFDPAETQRVSVDGDELFINDNVLGVGELRGFTGDGKEIVYVGTPAESSNIDVYAADLSTGAVRRITTHPEYVDPVQSSPDSQWWAIEDTRGTDRQMWLSGMRDIPPITDLISTSVTSSTRNNGPRRFFLPYLLDRWGDRGDYYGQRLNDQGSGEEGSGDYNDPMWNARADPWFSPDGTQIVWWEDQAVSPACGGHNPLPCYTSTEPGQREVRVVVATLTSRKPHEPIRIAPVSDDVPWSVPYTPESIAPARPQPPAGNYTLKGKVSGYAKVELLDNEETSMLNSVSVHYFAFSNDGDVFLNGTERVQTEATSQTVTLIDWHSDLTQVVGDVVNTKRTGPGGFQLTIDVLQNWFDANGTLTTHVDGKTYYQPKNFT